VEQDELSKRTIPTQPRSDRGGKGLDVFVPWVLTRRHPKKASNHIEAIQSSNISTKPQTPEHSSSGQADTKSLNRFYHMFGEGELTQLACEAAHELGLRVGSNSSADEDDDGKMGAEIVQSGWEKSNYYIEMRRWKT